MDLVSMRRLAARQHGFVTRAELFEHGRSEPARPAPCSTPPCGGGLPSWRWSGAVWARLAGPGRRKLGVIREELARRLPGYDPDAIELEGWEAHGTRTAFDADRARRNDLEAAGWHVLQFTWRMTDAEIVDVVRRVLCRLGALPRSPKRNRSSNFLDG